MCARDLSGAIILIIMDIWTPVVGEALLVKREPTNIKDKYAVAIYKDDIGKCVISCWEELIMIPSFPKVDANTQHTFEHLVV